MTIHKTLAQLTNQCVMCGLCIPHCPTYQLFQTESESPRGRIALFKALAEEQLEITAGMIEALDHCLACQACSKMCPSQVDYNRINNLGKALINRHDRQTPSTFRQRLAETMLETPSLHPLLKLTAKTLAPLQSLVKSSSNWTAMSNYSREIIDDSVAATPLKTAYPISEPKGQVILFTGCSGDLFDQQVMADSISLLNAVGYNVIIPDKQQCCGAIKLRHGDIQGMVVQAQQTIAGMNPWLSDSNAIVSVNNSCTGQLNEYDQLASYAEANTAKPMQPLSMANEIAGKTTDIIAFLVTALENNPVRFKPLSEDIAVHVPCSLRNVLKDVPLLFQLLKQIPGIRLHQLDDRYCCGAAGSYMLRYPDVANRLLDDKIQDINQHPCQTIVSSNLGCSLHFKQGLQKRDQAVAVMHPVRLLARQLITED